MITKAHLAAALLLSASAGPARAAVLTTALTVEAAPTPMLAAPAFDAPSFAVPSLTLAAPLQAALAAAPNPSGFPLIERVVPALAEADVRNPDARRAFTPVLARLSAAGADTPAKIRAMPIEALHEAVLMANNDVTGRLRDLSRRVFDGSGGFSAVSQNLGELRDLKAYGSPYLHNSGYNAVMNMALEEGPKLVVKLRAARKNGDSRRLSGALGLTLDPKLDDAAKDRLEKALAEAPPYHSERLVLHRLRGERGGVILVDAPQDAVSRDQFRVLLGRPGRMVEAKILSYDTYAGGSRTFVVTEYGTLTVGDETGPRWNEESVVAAQPGRGSR